MKAFKKYKDGGKTPSGKKVVKYNAGGVGPGKKKKPVTERDMDKIQNAPKGNFEYKYEDYMQQNASDITDNAALYKFFRVKESAKELNKMNINTLGRSPEQILSDARKKGIDVDQTAKDYFDMEVNKRKAKQQ